MLAILGKVLKVLGTLGVLSAIPLTIFLWNHFGGIGLGLIPMFLAIVSLVGISYLLIVLGAMSTITAGVENKPDLARKGHEQVSGYEKPAEDTSMWKRKYIAGMAIAALGIGITAYLITYTVGFSSFGGGLMGLALCFAGLFVMKEARSRHCD